MPRPVFTACDLQLTLSNHHVTHGRVVLLHSSLLHVGTLKDIIVSETPSLVIKIIYEAIAPEGTLVVLAPNYDYSDRRKIFDTRNASVSHLVGAINSTLANRDDAERSANPIFSVAAIGGQADLICNQSNATAFSLNSAWDFIAKLNARILMLGSSLAQFTMIRYIESQVEVPYLYHKSFSTPVLRNGRPIETQVTALLRYKNLTIKYDVSRFEIDLRNKGVLKESALGGGMVKSVDAAESIRIGKEGLNNDPYYFLAHPPKKNTNINTIS